MESNVERLGGRVAAIAVTATFSQMAFASHLGISFPLLSDWGGAVADAYGVRYDSWKGHDDIAKRSIFVIDRQGVVRYKWLTEDALQLPDLGEALAVIAQLGER
jgi:glutaredoxin-dependent peroxiredoxin